MKAIRDFDYTEVNPHTCAMHVREYLANSSAVENPEAEYDLDMAGVQLYEYMSAHSDDLIDEYCNDVLCKSPFDTVPDGVLADVCMACARDTEAEAER